MKKYIHYTMKQNKMLSFTIIPSTTNKIVQFTIPYWIPAAGALFMIVSFIFSIGISKEFFNVKEALIMAENQVAILEDENFNQAFEIEYLRNRSAEIEKKLLDLNQLQDRVLNMVGLDNEAKTNAVETFPAFLVTRSSLRPSIIDVSLEDGLLHLDQLIEQQKQSMEKLVVDVEKQLEYIDSIPNLQPTVGRLTSPYGYRISPTSRNREFHSGIDLANQKGTDIYASGSGIVTFSGYNGGYGRMVIISHGHGYTSVYAHNSSNLVKVGDKVNKGDVIAKMGSTGRSTGPHLHFEIRINGKAVDPTTILE
ncbi:M23 family metallopeptidase [Alkaliphilus crotonatoxidans]